MIFKEIRISGLSGLKTNDIIINFNSNSGSESVVSVGSDTLSLRKVIAYSEFMTTSPLKDAVNQDFTKAQVKRIFFLISIMSYSDCSKILSEIFTTDDLSSFYISIKFYKNHSENEMYWYFTDVNANGFLNQKLSKRRDGMYVDIIDDISSVGGTCVLAEYLQLLNSYYYFDPECLQTTNTLDLFEINKVLNTLDRGLKLDEVANDLYTLPNTDLSNFIGFCRYFDLNIKDIHIDLDDDHKIRIVSEKGRFSLSQMDSELILKFTIVYRISAGRHVNSCFTLVNDKILSPAFIRKVYRSYETKDNKLRSQIILIVPDDKYAASIVS